MSDQVGTVNSHVIDATTGVVTLLTGQAPSQSFGLLDVVMAETLGMVMYNAANRQQSAGAIGSAAVTAACARILSTQSSIVPPHEPPSPFVIPLRPPPPDPAPEVAVATAYTEAELAVQTLRAQAAAAATTTQMAQADLASLITQAGGTPPAPAPAPVAPPSPEVRVTRAVADARAAVGVLKARAGDPTAGRAELDTIIGDAGGQRPQTPRNIQTHATAADPKVTEAFAVARGAVHDLHALAASGAPVLREVRAGLDQIIADAGGTPPAQHEP